MNQSAATFMQAAAGAANDTMAAAMAMVMGGGTHEGAALGSFDNVSSFGDAILHNSSSSISNGTSTNVTAPEWMVNFVEFRRRLFLQTVEPVIVAILGPGEDDSASTHRFIPYDMGDGDVEAGFGMDATSLTAGDVDEDHRRLFSLSFPEYVKDASLVKATPMTFSSLFTLFLIMSCLMLIFLSCFYHNQKTSPLFISPRRHRLPKLVPPPLPVEGYFDWIRVCFYMSDEEIIQRIGYDALIFLRFHRLALRCIVKMAVFSFIVLLPLNFTGGGEAKADDLRGYVGSIISTDFMRFTMANVMGGSSRLWVHCFAAYLLTAIVVRELLIEYETFNSIRHLYLLSREPHLRTVLVTNIPRHLRSPSKISTYFRHVYPNAVRSVAMCQNLLNLEQLVRQRTKVLSKIEKHLLMLCRSEKRKLFERSKIWTVGRLFHSKLEDFGMVEGFQERFSKLYSQLEILNEEVEKEQKRRRRVMKKLDLMESGDGRKDIDYILASPFVMANDPNHQRLLGLQTDPRKYAPPSATGGRGQPQSDAQKMGYMDVGHQNSTAYHPPPMNAEGLRARSPPQPNAKPPTTTGERHVNFAAGAKDNSNSKPFVKAKSAIRRYSKLSRDVSLFGRPNRSTVTLDSDGHIEDHINEVTDKAFVVMRTFTAATIAIQSMHSSKPGAMQVSTAPEPRDVLWENIYLSKGAIRTRSFLGELLVLLIISFYIIPVATLSLLLSESALIGMSPRLAQLDQATVFFSSAIAMVQPLCIVTLQQLLPPLFMAITRLEGLSSFSEVQMRAFSRYFLFQVLNVFLVTTIAGSIFDTVATIVDNPESAFEMLGNSLPKMSSFFITFVTIKSFFGLGLELVRTMSLVQATIRYIFVPNATLRTARSIVMGMRAIDDPGWFPFHKILAQDMLVVVISVVFAVVAPLVLLPCAMFCLFSRIMWTHHHMYVYESVFESGGQFWPKIFRRFVFGLIIAQMTITGQFILKEARHEAYATIALMFMTYLFLRRTRARYDPTSFTLPLEVATVMDISLTQEQETKKRSQQHENQKRANDGQIPEAAGATTGQAPSLEPTSSTDAHDMRSQTTASLPDAGVVDVDSDLGMRIGRYDPFEKAYMQPALRANPRAKPEQPFPPAQLGREEIFFGNGASNAETLYDTGATLRLKSMNQQDRRMVNRWWDDQLQRCGDQNIFAILAGEECGTLTLGGRPYFNEPMPGDDSSHVFV